MNPAVVTDDAIHPLRRLETARDDLAERQRVRDQLRAARAWLDEAQARRRALRDQLTQHELDAERLESRTAARLWSALRGARQSDQERARTTAAETKAALQNAGAVLEPLRAELERLGGRVAQLDGADQQYEAALEAVAASGIPFGDRRVEDAVRELARLREGREVERARQAARAALQLLLRAREVLSGAVSWSTWDTLGGGGALSSDFKHERMDEARRRLSEANDAVVRLARLAVVFDGLSIPNLALREFSSLLKEIDIVWDNPLTDWMVHTEITQCQNELGRAIHQVRHVVESLDQRSAELSSGLAVR